MIPLRVTMDGFLSYQQPETFDFSDRPLWMLSGDNGSGKSSVFDAITFVLFKEHRGGKQNAADLINWQRDRLKVSFEFQVGAERYRAERTAERRGASTRRISRWDGAGWQTLPEGTGDTEFAGHVRRILGMDYDTFTSSALLCQGKVDRLLDVPPPDRFQLLSQIVDLSRYKRLHESAKLRQTKFRVTGEQEQARLARMPQVTGAEIVTAEEEAGAARTTEEDAQQRLNALAGLAVQAAQWETLTREAADLQAKVETANVLIGKEGDVRRRAARRAELTAALPLLGDLQAARGRRHGAEDAVNKARVAVSGEIRAQEPWAGPLSPAETLADRAARLETQFDAKITGLEAAHSALFLLQTLSGKRDTALAAQAEIAQLQLAKECARGLPYTEEAGCVSERIVRDEAQQARDAAADRLTRATTDREAAENRLHRLRSAQGAEGSEALCHYCGQQLSPERVATQLVTMAEELATCTSDEDAARLDMKTAGKAHETATARLQAAQKGWRAAVKSAEERDSKISAQEARLEEARQEAREASRKVPDGPYSERARGLFPAASPGAAVADGWPNDQSGFPTPAELTEVEKKSRSLGTWRQTAAGFGNKCTDLEACETTLSARLEDEARVASRLEPRWLSWYDGQPVSPDPLEALGQEYRGLAGAPAELTALEEALRDRQHWLTEVDNKARAIAALPEAARRARSVVDAEVGEAGAAHKLAKVKCRAAEAKAETLKRQKDDYEAARSSLHYMQQQEGVYKTLTSLLGREHLQRYLLGDAERAITVYANEALSAFSHGALRLEARPEGAGRGGRDEALDLLCINTESAGENPLPLTNLSGSQKFRVAVALALGIGRYAGRNDARIESVIIDEGFGSLDRQNQQDMADAIRSLADDRLLKRIIVVSHQEAFADRFPDRIHVELGPDGSRRAEI